VVPAAPSRRTLAHYGAPAAFLVGITVVVVLIHSALGGSGSGRTGTTLGPVTHASTAPVPPKTHTVTHANTGTLPSSSVDGASSVAGAQYTTVQRGDTFFAIATRSGTTVAEIESLNPGVSSNTLRIGQQIRVK
jgi:LysM repeat protein